MLSTSPTDTEKYKSHHASRPSEKPASSSLGINCPVGPCASGPQRPRLTGNEAGIRVGAVSLGALDSWPLHIITPNPSGSHPTVKGCGRCRYGAVSRSMILWLGSEKRSFPHHGYGAADLYLLCTTRSGRIGDASSLLVSVLIEVEERGLQHPTAVQITEHAPDGTSI